MNKRYAIVKVNWKCPNKDNKEEIEDIFVCANRKDKREQNHNCNDCLYGDTKEQLIRKVAQVLYRDELKWYKTHLKFVPSGKIDEPFLRNIYENCLAKATKIIESLGVEE